MGKRDLPEVVALLAAGEEAAWGEFLESYAPLILQVVRLFEHDVDRTGDSFLFVCEALRRNRFRRIRRYRANGPASFDTWLRAVVRNLFLDWRRAEVGRRVRPRWVVELPPVEREAFELLYRRGLTTDETLGALQTLFPRLTRRDCLAALDRLASHRAIGRRKPRSPRPRLVSLTVKENNPRGEREVPSPGPDPEELALVSERSARVMRAVAGLPSFERLLVRLRFEEELPLAEVARLTGLDNPQAADRRLRAILARLHSLIDAEAEAEPEDSV